MGQKLQGGESVMIPGDIVYWTSGAMGKITTKRGEVIAVVKSGDMPGHTLAKWMLENGRSSDKMPIKFDASAPRKHESYLVLVGTAVYWPRVRHLRSEKTICSKLITS